MKVYLSSDRIGTETGTLEKWIDEHEKEPKIWIIPNALDAYKAEEQQQMKKTIISKYTSDLTMILGFDTQVLDLQEYFGKSDELRKRFEECRAFFAIGGNVFSLRKAMQLSGFDTILKEKCCEKEEYLYAGDSAGICVLAPTLHGYDSVDVAINPYDNDEVLYEGIGILDYMPVPHYNPTTSEPNDKGETDEIGEIIKYCKKNNIEYKTLKDGETITEDIENVIKSKVKKDCERND